MKNLRDIFQLFFAALSFKKKPTVVLRASLILRDLWVLLEKHFQPAKATFNLF